MQECLGGRNLKIPFILVVIFTVLDFAPSFCRPTLIRVVGISDSCAQQAVLDETSGATSEMRVFKWKHSLALFTVSLTSAIQDGAFQDSVPLQHSRFSAAPFLSFN